ncbi:MAG: hypothetical protein NC115_03780 [Bacteroidales bacterium]|nr:hypothetical protein [Bacteroidales bacterium]
MGATVEAITDIDSPSSSISVLVPLQEIGSGEKKEVSNIVTPIIKFMYSVDKSGNISVGDDIDYSGVYGMSDISQNIHFMDVGSAKVKSLSDKGLAVEVILSYYDYYSDSMVTGFVTLDYRWKRSIECYE